MSWDVAEYERRVFDRRSLFVIGTILFLIVIYAILTSQELMAITFMLIAIVGYLYQTREPTIIHAAITRLGVMYNRSLYTFDDLQSFWIDYNPEQKIAELSLQTTSDIFPYVKIPLGDADPTEIHKLLNPRIPEIEHPKRLIDILERTF